MTIVLLTNYMNYKMNMKDKNILIIGDSHIASKINFNSLGEFQKPRTVNIITEPFANFKDSVTLASIHLESTIEVDLLLLLPFLWELVYIRKNEQKNRFMVGNLQLKEYIDYSLKGLLLEVKSITTRWLVKYPGLQVCWCLPYTPDFARFNNIDSSYSNIQFAEDQRQAREFHARIKKFLEVWSVEIPEILLLNFNDCYFLRENFMEDSFLKSNFSQLYFPTICTADGLVPSAEFVSRFLEVFKERVYPLLVTDTAQRVQTPITYKEASSLSTYSSEEAHGYQEKQASQYSVVIDYQHSKKPVLDTSYPVHGNPSLYQTHPISPSTDNSSFCNSYSLEYGHTQTPQYHRNYYETRSIHHNTLHEQYYENSNFQDYNPASAYLNQDVPGRDDNYFQDTNTRKLPYSTESNLSQRQSETTNLGTGIFELLSGSSACSEVKEISPGFNLPNISDGLLITIKDALNFLTAKQNDSDVYKVERKLSPYAKPLSTIFNPQEWTDLFLSGDLNIALDCLHYCTEGIDKFESKKGLKVIMVTSSQEIIDAAEKSFSNLVEQNKLGINDNIPFGAPVFLVDLPCHLRMRLSQPKFQNLSQLVALLVFGDCLLSNKTPSNIEFIHLIKYILSKASTENLCKIVISESGSTEAEVVAQNALKTTFYAPKKEVQCTAEKENLKEKPCITEFLSRIETERETANSAGMLCVNSSRVSTKSPSKEKSSSPSRKRKKKSHSQREWNENSSLTSSDKLESIFKLAHIPISEEELNEYNQHDKDFMSFLEPLGHTAEKEYMMLGRDALMAHEADYKSYKEVPDLHPAFEEKYELFVKRFEETYGKDYNPQHLQKTWKHFWDITISNLQEKEWKEKKKKLQDSFQKKYASKAAEIAALKLRGKDRARSHKGSDGKKAGVSDSSKALEKSNDDDIIFIKMTSLSNEGLSETQKLEKEKKGQRKETEISKEKEKIGKGKEREIKNDKEKESYQRMKISPDMKLDKNQRENKTESAFQALSVDEDFKKIYLESCSNIAKKSNAKTYAHPDLIDDFATPKLDKPMKPEPIRPRDESKPKIVFNLGRPKGKEEKPKFSLEVALHYLETVSSKIGVMGPALLSIVEQAKEQLKISPYEAFKIFTDKESELLVNIAISKLKTLIASSPWSQAEMYRSALPLFQKLLSEAKEVTKKPAPVEKKKTFHQLDLQAIAKATIGFDTESLFNFIKNTFLYKGLSEPSKEELNAVFKEVSAIHFQLAISS